jgi:hypothetical protein
VCLQDSAGVEVVAGEAVHLPCQDPSDLAAFDTAHKLAKNGSPRGLGRAGLSQRDAGNLDAVFARELLKFANLGVDRENLAILGFRRLARIDDIRDMG